jgi:hypothetical protein
MTFTSETKKDTPRVTRTTVDPSGVLIRMSKGVMRL